MLHMYCRNCQLCLHMYIDCIVHAVQVIEAEAGRSRASHKGKVHAVSLSVYMFMAWELYWSAANLFVSSAVDCGV